MSRPSAPDVRWYARVRKGPHPFVSVRGLHVHDTFFILTQEIRMIPSSRSRRSTASDPHSGLSVKVFTDSVKDFEAHPCICPARFLRRRIIQAESATFLSGLRSGEAETMKNGSPALLDNELPVAFSAQLPKIKITCLF